MTDVPDAQSRVKLRDVAEQVGITAAAASMALADSPRISAKTKTAVRAAAARLGYVPSSAGRALRSQRAGAIALIVPNTTQHVFGHSYFMHVLTGVSSVANERDTQVLVSTNPDEAHGLAAYERVMRSKSADGAIVTSAAVTDLNIERLSQSGLPLVLIGNFPYLPTSVSVGIDDVAASRSITEHLIQAHGRTRLLHVTGPMDHQTAIDRREGFLAAVAAHGLLGSSRIVEGDFSEQAGTDAVLGLGPELREIDGIVFANDDMAFGGLQVLKSRGIAVPQDVSIVGFDDFGLSRLTTPGITTVHVPADDMARVATERLFDLIDGIDPGPSHHELAVRLVLRESCGCGATGT
ncbi:MAG TPA: LacI family DNA-binding transcriptional regulator [Lacisediminihabitans sp.]|uniref:LacI family DNA-binding transcriptional regulator n=1 Tax=Lacisediminihabitans sp. TaxID=2787631 RepID=UPI002EDBA577